MTTSELIGLLQKVNQIAGDVPVAVRAAEDAAETILTELSIHVPALPGAHPAVHIVHSTEAPVPPAAGSEPGQIPQA